VKIHVFIGACLLAVTGCGDSSEVEAARTQLLAERAALENALDDLQARLLVNRARVGFWTDLAERHESVSAVACASNEGHAEEMARLLQGRPEKRQGLRRQVAARTGPIAPSRPATGRGGP
jgi:hypothetical protein